MFAVHGYKWMLSPNGAGFFYIAPQLRERLQPNVVGWRSHRDWRNVDNLHHGVPEFAADGRKIRRRLGFFRVALCNGSLARSDPRNRSG